MQVRKQGRGSAASLALILLSPLLLAAEINVEPRFSDRFEQLESQLLRVDLLALRDPHLYVEVELFPGVPLCIDITDDAVSGVPSFNGLIDQSINLDGNDDGFLDVSPMIALSWHQPDSGQIALADGLCTAPAESTQCELQDQSPGQWFESLEIGLCRAALPGTVRPYDPPVPEIDGPCLGSAISDFALEISGLQLQLQAATIGAGLTTDDQLAPMLLRGFLSEADADKVLIPPEIDLIGGQPLSALLPGGDGNCASHSDLDQFQGQSGWWFYFELSALAPSG
jgi:hypothetical protein